MQFQFHLSLKMFSAIVSAFLIGHRADCIIYAAIYARRTSWTHRHAQTYVGLRKHFEQAFTSIKTHANIPNQGIFIQTSITDICAAPSSRLGIDQWYHYSTKYLMRKPRDLASPKQTRSKAFHNSLEDHSTGTQNSGKYLVLFSLNTSPAIVWSFNGVLPHPIATKPLSSIHIIEVLIRNTSH